MMKMQWVFAAAMALGVTCAAQAQGIPGMGGGLPGGMSSAEAMALYQTLTPQQRQMLAVQGIQGKGAVNPSNALAWYQSMTPQQKQMAKDWAKQNPSQAAAYKEQAKSFLKSMRGN